MRRIALLLVVVFVAVWPGQADAQATVVTCPQESTFILRPGETFSIAVPAFSALRIGQENTGSVVAERPPGGPIAIQPGRSLFVNDSPATDVQPFTNVSTTQFIAVYACTLQLASTPTPTRTPTTPPTSTPTPTPTQPAAFNQCFTLPMRTGMKYNTSSAPSFGGVDFTTAPVGTPVSGASRGGTLWESISGWPAGLANMQGWWVRAIAGPGGGKIIRTQEIDFVGAFRRIPTNEAIGIVWGSNVTASNGLTVAEFCPPNFIPPGNNTYDNATLCYSVSSTLVLYVGETVFGIPTAAQAVVWNAPNAQFAIPGFVSNGQMWLSGNFQGWTFQRTSGSGTISISSNLTVVATVSNTNTSPVPITVATERLAITSGDVSPFTGLLCVGTAPTFTPTATGTAPPSTATPTRTATATATPYPTPAANCELVSVPAAGGTVVTQKAPGYVYAQNGIARIVSTETGETIFADQAPKLYNGDEVTIERVTVFNAGDLILRVIFCAGAPSPTPTGTATAPPLPCPVADSISIPPAPGVAPVTLSVGIRFVVTGAPVFFNVGDTAREIRPGSYQWNLEPGTFDAYTITIQATVYICVEAQPTPTGTAEPTPTGSPLDEVCVPGVTPAPAQTGQIPRLSLIIPTLEAFPTRTATATAAVTITASLVISPAQTLVAVLIEPVQTVTAWCQTTFAGGWIEGQSNANTHIAEPVSDSFAWLWLFQYIGPLSWLIPPVLITVLVKVIRPLISLVKYVKQILPFQ